MPQHLVAFTRSTATAANTFEAMNCVADSVLAQASATAFWVKGGMRVVTGYVGSDAGTPFLLGARINSPTFRRVGLPNIRPMNATRAPGGDPNVMVIVDRPLHYPDSDTLTVEIIASGATPDTICLLWLETEREPVPPGETYWLRYTSTSRSLSEKAELALGPGMRPPRPSPTAAEYLQVFLGLPNGRSGSPSGPMPSFPFLRHAPSAAVATWTQLVISFDQLPEGEYIVCGMEHVSATCLGARLVFPGSPWRPGTLGQSSLTNQNHAVFYDDRLGVFGRFNAFAPPTVEVFCTAADASHTGFLRVLRVR